MARFATAADLAKYLQTTFDATQTTNAELLLDLVSADIQAYTNQTIAAVSNDTVTLDGPDSDILFLPELPVNGVDSITLDGTVVASSGYHVYGTAGYVKRANGVSWGAILRSVVVQYDHGYSTIPDAVRHAALKLAALRWNNPDGLESETIGNYSYTAATGSDPEPEFDPWAALDRYRVLVIA